MNIIYLYDIYIYLTIVNNNFLSEISKPNLYSIIIALLGQTTLPRSITIVFCSIYEASFYFLICYFVILKMYVRFSIELLVLRSSEHWQVIVKNVCMYGSCRCFALNTCVKADGPMLIDFI